MAQIAEQMGSVTSNVLTNYDFFDIAEGTGIVAYYGAKSSSGYFLTNNAEIASNDLVSTSTGTILNAVNFDVTFNLPKNIRGTLYANIPCTRDAGNNGNLSFTVTVYHYDGSTETQLATASTNTPNNSSSALEDRYHYVLMQLTLAFRHFKKGETLRIKVTAASSASTTGAVGHDPLNRAYAGFGDIDNTRMKFLVPFILDI